MVAWLQPCSTHRILMALRQGPEAQELLYEIRPIVPSVAPCWHAITQAVFAFDLCLFFFFSSLILSLTSLPMFLSSSRELFLPSGTCVRAYAITF